MNRKPIICSMVLVIIALTFFIILIWGKERDNTGEIENIFDEMMFNECEGLRKLRNISVTDYQPHMWVSMEYKHNDRNIESTISCDLYNKRGLGTGDPLRFSFDITNPEMNYKADMVFEYNRELKKLSIYVLESEGEMPFEEREKYRDYLLNNIIINHWLRYGDSRYGRNNIGEFEILNDLIPYEYSGIPECKALNEEIIEYKDYTEKYITWFENENLICIQNTIEFHYEFDEVMQEAGGMNLSRTQFRVKLKKNQEECVLSDIINVDESFIDWMKESGKVIGNLQKIPKNREDGCKNTQKMLKQCPKEEMEIALEQCEFYIEPEYLHIRFPYWNDNGELSGWEKNGNELWKGWITMKTEDIERFLKVEKW